MIASPIIAILHDQAANRWHPIYLSEAPLPGPPSDSTPRRWKSKGHHTAGFATREEAIVCARGELADAVRASATGDLAFALDHDILWDGEGIPAMVSYFAVSGDTAELLF